MSLYQIPPPILQNLLCGHCRKFVTCGPVHVAPDSSILCGRCLRFAKKSYRNVAFEALASLFYYPCYYWPKHCNKKLSWNEALQHEKKCLFQSSCNVFCSRPGTFFKSDRKLPHSTEIHHDHIPEELLEQLKCVVCNLYLSNSPVFLLIDGKNICHRCVHSNGQPRDSIRNLAYETLAVFFFFPCIFRFQGCTFRRPFGRDLWAHEAECPYGKPQKLQKKPSKILKDGKERGVIQTHSGHIWGTITPHSALFAPPKSNNEDGKLVTQEIEEVWKRKHHEEVNGFDSQSVDSVMSKSTLDSLDYLGRDNVSRSTIDNISRTTADNISRSSSRLNARVSNDPYHEVAPLPTPPGYNKIPNNGYYQENVERFSTQLYSHPELSYSGSFNFPQTHTNIQPQRTESFRVGNQGIIDELKFRQRNRASLREENPYKNCANLKDLVQKVDEVSN